MLNKMLSVVLCLVQTEWSRDMCEYVCVCVCEGERERERECVGAGGGVLRMNHWSD